MRVQVVKPTVISLFAGAGGSSLGYHLAGYEERLAVEWDANAVATFRLNFPTVPVFHGDIATLTSEEAMRLARVRPGELDVLDGSPPCQGFSTAGNRRYSDPRNSLFIEYARLLRDLQPRAFVMENVKGLVQGPMKQAYLRIIDTLRGCGYRARGQIMNAMFYDVPQSRQRVIVIGVRSDLGIEPSHPKPRSAPAGITRLDERPKRFSPRRFGDKIVREGQPVPTLTKMDRRFWDRRTEFGPLSYAAAASFPETFQFAGGHTQRLACIGNSVPPNLMRAIAEHVKVHALGFEPSAVIEPPARPPPGWGRPEQRSGVE